MGETKMEPGGKWRLTRGKDGKVKGGKVRTSFVHQKGPDQGRPQDTGTEEL